MKVHSIKWSFSQSKAFGFNKISSRFVSLMDETFHFTQISQIHKLPSFFIIKKSNLVSPISVFWRETEYEEIWRPRFSGGEVIKLIAKLFNTKSQNKGATNLSITTLSTMTFSMTLIKHNTQHNDSLVMLSVKDTPVLLSTLNKLTFLFLANVFGSVLMLACHLKELYSIWHA